MQPEIFAILQHRPGQPRILRGDRDDGSPVAASFDQAARPPAEPVLLGAEACQDGASAHDKQAAQVMVAGLGDAPQPRFAATAVLPWNQPDPRGNLAAVGEFVAAAELATRALAVVGPMPGSCMRRRLAASSRAAWAMVRS